MELMVSSASVKFIDWIVPTILSMRGHDAKIVSRDDLVCCRWFDIFDRGQSVEET